MPGLVSHFAIREINTHLCLIALSFSYEDWSPQPTQLWNVLEHKMEALSEVRKHLALKFPIEYPFQEREIDHEL